MAADDILCSGTRRRMSCVPVMCRPKLKVRLGATAAPAYRIGPSNPRTTESPSGCQPMTVDALTTQMLDCQSSRPRTARHTAIDRPGQFRSFDGALEKGELMAESEDLKLQRRTAPEGSENSGRES